MQSKPKSSPNRRKLGRCVRCNRRWATQMVYVDYKRKAIPLCDQHAEAYK